MKIVKRQIKPFFSIVIIGFLIALIIGSIKINAQVKDTYTVLNFNNEIGEGKDKEVNLLFDGERRKIAHLTLRNSMNLKTHSVAEPIIIQCIAGQGELLISTEDGTEMVKLLPGTVLTIESNIEHDVIGKPSVSILLFRFLDK